MSEKEKESKKKSPKKSHVPTYYILIIALYEKEKQCQSFY